MYYQLVKTKIQGLLLSKRPFQNNHIIGNLLLRNGKKVVVVFYGGRGGGKKNSPSLLEPGFMYDLEMAKSKKNSDLYRAKEWDHLWIHQKARNNYQVYCILCFFLEVVDRIAPEEDLWEIHDDPHSDNEGLFRILSNSLFYLEKRLEEGKTNVNVLIINFLCKLINEQGFLPMIDSCCLTEDPIRENEPVLFMHEKGGFAKMEHIHSSELSSLDAGKEGAEIRSFFKEVTFAKTSDLVFRNIRNPQIVRSIFHYFCYQSQIQPSNFKTYRYL